RTPTVPKKTRRYSTLYLFAQAAYNPVDCGGCPY
ncbi:MAG: hypothetical protein ACI8PG_004114, partial [Planctomycetota bacterium]